jgi:predicted transcriptional regulator
MAFARMSVQQRQVCEFLSQNPGSTSAEIIAGTCFPYDSVKKKLRALRKSGHVKGSESNYRSSFQLTGKKFPRLADYQPNARYLASKVRMETNGAGCDALFTAMHAMVMTGRGDA